ncbi:AbrB/MazE/SpoVT family DNA-binding domain-containing protein [Anaerotignum sp.]|uniref:AbrB/MazE/SpoVT family DNA-binding domain-containing protein n=1 Tax=Anaerotignum sp. TaxID=2039241 RepID=UPI0028B05660|nr:AbrB/MazE/SpoVT family DNA-binding domain-containing protein [Anaerotignum sp.]
MKATGIVRKVDDLGRVVLPIELRRNLGIGIGDPLEIYTENDAIVLKRYNAVDDIVSVAERLKKMIEAESSPKTRAEMLNTIGEILEATKKENAGKGRSK